MIISTGESYGFIDGNYLEMEFKRLYADIVGLSTEIDFATVKNELQLQRVYYYSAVDEQVRNGESDAALSSRISEANERLDKINAIDGFHVRKGSVKGKGNGDKRRQKQVDVQLAVDALLHAINRNMRQAVLVAGDLDFKPLVDALVSLGVHTHVWCAQRSSAKEFRAAADRFANFTSEVAERWAVKTADPAYAIPREVGATLLDHTAGVIETGEWKDKVLELRRGETYHYLTVSNRIAKFETAYRHPKPDTLKRFFDLHHGKATWADSKA